MLPVHDSICNTEPWNPRSTAVFHSIEPRITSSMKVICSAEFQNIASTRRIPQRIKAQILRVHEATYKVFFLSETPHFTPRYWEHLWNVCTTTVTLLGVPSPFGHKLLTIWVVRPLHETALLKGFKYESVNVPLCFRDRVVHRSRAFSWYFWLLFRIYLISKQ